MRHHLDVLRAAGLAPARLRLGGGGTRNPAWLQATADATGLELDVVAHAGEAIGPCDLALRAVGLEPVDRVAATVAPDRGARAARFDRLAPLYATLHPALAAVMHELGRLDQLEDAARMTPATMRVARLHGVGDLRVETVPVPQPASGELLVRVEACGVCPTDVRKFVLGLHADEYPLNPGHEWVGRVEAVGAGVEGWAPGERLYGDTYAGYGEYALLRARAHGWSAGAVRLDDDLPVDRAVFVEPLADCLHAVLDQGRVGPDDRVLVVGAGQMGLQLVAVAARAARRVLAADGVAERRALAAEFGAATVVGQRRVGGGGARVPADGGDPLDRRGVAGRGAAGRRSSRVDGWCCSRASATGRAPRSTSTASTTASSRWSAASGSARRRTCARSATRRPPRCSPRARCRWSAW